MVFDCDLIFENSGNVIVVRQSIEMSPETETRLTSLFNTWHLRLVFIDGTRDKQFQEDHLLVDDGEGH